MFDNSYLENISDVLNVKLNNQFDFRCHDFANVFVANLVFVVVIVSKNFYSIAKQFEFAILLNHNRNDITTIFEAILHNIDNESQTKRKTKIENEQEVEVSNDEIREQRKIIVFLNAIFVVEFASSNDLDIKRIKTSIDFE